ncbi:MAG: hypothetical protein GY795_20260 [Desulfobacterales bacterium]|nr:hypothetical protein [Desulfobacterales bacterium]
MKIAEVRTLLEKYSEKQLRYIIAEMYKAIPKATKEANDIDSILNTPDKPTRLKTKQKKQPKISDTKALQNETEQFIEYAYNQYYFAPNKFVPKQQRSKWRFIAKRLYNELLDSGANKDQLPLASKLLEKLYEMLCYSCSYTLFSGYDSFQSVGIEQSTFFKSVLLLKSNHTSLSEFIKQAISLVVNNSLNRETLYTTLMENVLEFLSSPDAKELAVESCDELLQEIKALPKKSKKAWHDDSEYVRNEKINNLVEMAFLSCGQLSQFERGIQYFQTNYIEKSPEIKLFVLLHLLFSFQQTGFFVQEYENALKRGIKPREKLTEIYENIQEKGEFPEYFY